MDCIDSVLLFKAHPFIHTLVHRRRCQPCKATVGSSWVWCLALRHLDIWFGGSPGSNQQPVARQPFYLLRMVKAFRQSESCSSLRSTCLKFVPDNVNMLPPFLQSFFIILYMICIFVFIYLFYSTSTSHAH